jgi:hypothetical protein
MNQKSSNPLLIRLCTFLALIPATGISALGIAGAYGFILVSFNLEVLAMYLMIVPIIFWAVAGAIGVISLWVIVFSKDLKNNQVKARIIMIGVFCGTIAILPVAFATVRDFIFSIFLPGSIDSWRFLFVYIAAIGIYHSIDLYNAVNANKSLQRTANDAIR